MTVRVLHPVSPEDYLDWFNLESRRPLLELARQNARPLGSVKLEWIVDRFVDGVLRYSALTNYTQILRQPFQRKRLDDGTYETFAVAAKRAGEKILDDAERTLWYGKPRYDVSGGHPISWCGGVLHYLKRRVYENDAVVLRELTPLKLYTSRGEHDWQNEEELHTHEWIWEFSLQVIPGHYERGMFPVCLPPSPKPVTPNAHAQGAPIPEEELITV